MFEGQHTAPSCQHEHLPQRNTVTMPTYFAPSRQLPLTPPEFYEPYACTGKPLGSQGSQPSYDQMQYANSFFMNSAYYQPSQAERRARHEEAMARQLRANYQAQQRKYGYGHGPIAAPVLPPIQVQETQTTVSHGCRQEVASQAAKQEKSAGGVAAELDYEMDTMVDFVAQMTTGMWTPFVARHDLSHADLVRLIQPTGTTVEKQFRQYVQSVLTSTRLPSATLLLALHYLSDRIKLRSGRGDFPHRFSSNLYHHLTVALMLASKFLDDNTFQNRSWAEVSHLPVNELNAREMDWLHDIRWQLHVDWEEAEGVRLWFVKWAEYKAMKSASMGDLSLSQLQLNPIMTPTPITTPTRDMSQSADSAMIYEHVRLPNPAEIQWPQIRSLSPPSAGPTHASTPEYYNSASNTPCYLPTQQSFAQQPAYTERQGGIPEPDGHLVYTRQSPLYGPGYVCETRQRGSHFYDTHSFVGLDYTKQYAVQLEVGWCEHHRRYNCYSCASVPSSMYSQVAAA